MIAQSRAIGLCGDAFEIKNKTFSSATPTHHDRFGNIYAPLFLQNKKEQRDKNFLNVTDNCGCEGITDVDENGDPLTLATSTFNIAFEDCILGTGEGFDDAQHGEARKKVLCRVFYDLAQLIRPMHGLCNTTPSPTNIQVIPSSLGSVDSYFGFELPDFPILSEGVVLGYASPYYLIDNQDGLIHGLPWQKINTGVTADANNYDGFLRFNFANNINWELDYAAATVVGQDFYGVCYHEALHMLGFDGGLNHLGHSEIMPESEDGAGGYLSFAQFLYEQENATTLTPLIVNHPSPSSAWYQHPTLPFDVYSDCSTNAANQVVFVGQNGHYPVYVGNEYSAGSSFSHLEIDCAAPNAEQYLMHPFIPENTKRRITDAEKDILASLGYFVEGIDPCVVGGVVDYGPLWVDGEPACEQTENYSINLCSGETLAILVKDLIYNDVGATDVAFVEVDRLSKGQISSMTMVDGEAAYLFTPEQTGICELIYVPLGCNEQLGNVTSIFINVFEGEGCITQCEELTTCEEFNTNQFCYEAFGGNETLIHDQNLVCNPTFKGSFFTYTEQELPRKYLHPYLASLRAAVPGWHASHGSPDIVLDDMFDEGSGAIYMGAEDGVLCGDDNAFSEGVYTYANLAVGKHYLLSFQTGSYPIYDSDELVEVDLNVALIEGQHIGPPFVAEEMNCPHYIGIEEMSIGEYAVEPTPYNNQRKGASFASTDAYNAIWFYANPASIDTPLSAGKSAGVRLDDVELIEDEFPREYDVHFSSCVGQAEIGQPFDMLTDVTVQYRWFERIGEEETWLLTYLVLNGEVISVNNPNNYAFDEETHQLTIVTNQNKSFELKRTVIEGVFDGSFQFSDAPHKVNFVFNGSGTPNASFAIEQEECHHLLVPLYYNGEQITWTINGEVSTLPIQADGTLVVYLEEGMLHTVELELSNSCGEDASTQTTQNDCADCLLPDVEIVVDEQGCGEVAFSFVNNDLTQTIENVVWMFGDNNYSTDFATTHTYIPGTYEVELFVQNDCGETSVLSYLLKVPTYAPSFAFEWNYSDKRCNFIEFSVVGDNIQDQIVWHFGDGTPAIWGGIQMTHFYPENDGDYTVTAIAFSSCANATPNVLSYTSQVSIDCDLNNFDVGSKGIVEQEGNHTTFESIDDYNVYPIPANDYIVVEANKKDIQSISIVDVTGQKVLTQNWPINTTAMQLDVSHLLSGIYFVQLTGERTKPLTKRILIQH